MKAYLCGLIILSFSCCSWGKKGLFLKEEKKEDLMEVLNVDKTLVKEFVTTDSPNSIEGQAPAVFLDETVLRDKKDSLKEFQRGEALRKKKEKKAHYPLDYPAKYKGYNQKYAPLWREEHFGVLHGEEMEIDVKYLGVVAGKIIMMIMPNKFLGDKKAYHIRGEFHSASFYRYIYEVRGSIETFLDVKTFLPLKYSLLQKAVGKKVSDLQIFDHENYKTHSWYRKEKKGKIKKKKKTVYIPAYFQDYFGALQFIRNLSLAPGKVYEFPLVNRGKVQFLEVDVLKKEKIELSREKYESIKVRCVITSMKKDKRKTTSFFWLAPDETKRILQFNVQTKLGTIYGNLVRYRRGRKRSGG